MATQLMIDHLVRHGQESSNKSNWQLTSQNKTPINCKTNKTGDEGRLDQTNKD